MYESKDDFDSFSTARAVSVMDSATSWEETLRGHGWCAKRELGPDGVDFVLQAMRVMFVEYPAMSCTCKLGG